MTRDPSESFFSTFTASTFSNPCFLGPLTPDSKIDSSGRYASIVSSTCISYGQDLSAIELVKVFEPQLLESNQVLNPGLSLQYSSEIIYNRAYLSLHKRIFLVEGQCATIGKVQGLGYNLAELRGGYMIFLLGALAFLDIVYMVGYCIYGCFLGDKSDNVNDNSFLRGLSWVINSYSIMAIPCIALC